MSRKVEISLPPDKTDAVLEELREAPGIVGLTLHRHASLKPPGDVLIVHTTNEGLEHVQTLVDHPAFADGRSVVTSEPRSMVSSSQQSEIDEETNEASWPEMAALLRREANVTSNYLLAMFFAGVVAAVGLWTNTVHIVIGAMVIAPGFEPLIRVPFGALSHSRDWESGLKATGAGYGALLLGACGAAAVLMLIEPNSGRLADRYWVQYWSTVKPPSILVALAAGAAGAAIIAAQRSVLTAGVMIALALIPSASIVGMTIPFADSQLLVGAAGRWATDTACVVIGGGGLFLCKRALMHRRQRQEAPDAEPHAGGR